MKKRPVRYRNLILLFGALFVLSAILLIEGEVNKVDIAPFKAEIDSVPGLTDRQAQAVKEVLARSAARHNEANRQRRALGVFIVAIYGALIYLLYQVARRQDALELRRDTQYAVSRAVSESADIGEAAGKIIKALCGMTGWDVGAIWEVDRARQDMFCTDVLSSPAVSAESFVTVTRSLRLRSGVGLPGRVWQSAKPAWISDVVIDPNFPRSEHARKDGLHGAVGFPILIKQEVVGVIEFFSREVKKPDNEISALFELVGNHIAHLIERQRNQREIRLLNSGLKEQLAEQARVNRELTELSDKLTQARDQALDSSRVKSQFLANVSHEIRTPMNSIIGMLDELLRSPLTGDQRDCADLAIESARSLLGLIDDILDFSRIEAGKITIETRSFSIRQMVDRVLEVLAKEAARKSLDLKAQVAEDVPDRVSGDPARIRQVLLNLIANAIKFTERGSITVAVAAASERVRFSVIDSGIGVEASAIPTLFQPFRQADGSISRRYGGTGLGLSICKGLVDLLGGEMGVESQVDCGSTFWFELPLPACQQDSPGGNEPGSAESEPAHTDIAARPLILVAEDNVVNQKVATLQLRRLGYEVETAGNGAEALAALSRQPFALVLMDCQMPEMDGLEATRRIRQSEALTGRHVPIIALTAHAMDGDRERCLAAGMDDYVSKPIDFQTLQKKMLRWLSGGFSYDEA